MDNPICMVELPADDVNSLIDFYSKLLGWKFEKMPGPVDYYIAGEEGKDAVPVGMMQRQDPQQPPVYYVNVESIDTSLQQAKDLGATEIMGKTPVPNYGWFAVVLDPQKNPLGFWEDDKNAA